MRQLDPGSIPAPLYRFAVQLSVANSEDLVETAAGVVLVLLVLSMQSDWQQPNPRLAGSAVRSAPRTGQLKEGVREKASGIGMLMFLAHSVAFSDQHLHQVATP